MMMKGRCIDGWWEEDECGGREGERKGEKERLEDGMRVVESKSEGDGGSIYGGWGRWYRGWN